MNRRVLILDTSVLCCWLQVPGKEEAGPLADRWNHARVSTLIALESARSSTLVLPIATLIETGNHIAQAAARRYEAASSLADCLRQTATAQSPWAAFTDQATLWEPAKLIRLADDWPPLAVGGFSIGDTTIKEVAGFYARGGYRVEILTGDAGSKAYEPTTAPRCPRRRGGH